jgi:predicted phage-related endonuclease
MTITKSTAAPGSNEWHARRQRAFNASDAGAALGCDPNKTRTQLLHELHTGLQQEFSDYVRARVIEPGHRIEALARPLGEYVIEDDLQVIGAARDFGLSRPLGASMDGIDFMETIGWECKRANEELRAALPHSGRDSADLNDPAAIPKAKRAQMAHQQLVFDHKRTLFTVADFDAAGNVIEERHCWYDAEPDLQREVLAAWKQFDADLATYTPPAASAVEKIVAELVEALPAVSVKVEGSIVIRENFDAFERAMRDFLDHRLIRSPQSDQDFADLDVQIKAMKGAEEALDAAEAGWIAQIEAVGAAKRRKDVLRALVRDNRLMAEKLLSSEKERRRGEIVAGGIKALRDHIAGLNARLGQHFMPASATAVDFGAAIKGMRSLASMENAVSTTLANAKVAANELADKIDRNMKALPGLVGDRIGLTPDLAQIVLKAPDDFAAVVGQRVTTQKQAEERRAAELAERERERIRAEEQAKAERDAREQLQREQAERERATEALRKADEMAATRAQPGGVLAGPVGAAVAGAVAQPTAASLPPAPAANVVQLQRPAAPSAAPTLKLGDLNARIAPLSLSEAGLIALGFPAARRERNACMYHEQDFPHILAAIVRHVEGLQAKQAA